MDLYSILGQQLSVNEALPPETAPAAAVLSLRAQPPGAAELGEAEAEDNRGQSESSAQVSGVSVARSADQLSAPESYPGDIPEIQPAQPGVLSVQDAQPSNEDLALALRLLAEAKLHALLASTVERVRYITNASGIALALCENEEDAMVCHASSGPAAPEVGARMYIRSGITAESLRTRQTLRCDRASTDPRVNQESCKALGIESVLVMPVVLSGSVVGMFQLFGSRAAAFTERDANTLRASIPQVEAGLHEGLSAGIVLGRIPWAEEPKSVEPVALPAQAETDTLENGESEVPTARFPFAVPIDSFRRAETSQDGSQDAANSPEQEVPAFLARLADEARPAPSRSWSQWFRPQW